MHPLRQVLLLSSLATLGLTAVISGITDPTDREISISINLDTEQGDALTANPNCDLTDCLVSCRRSSFYTGACGPDPGSCICYKRTTPFSLPRPNSLLRIPTSSDPKPTSPSNTKDKNIDANANGDGDHDPTPLPPLCDRERCLAHCLDEGFKKFTCGVTGRSCICLDKGDEPLPPPACDKKVCATACRGNGFPTGSCSGFTGLTCICRGKAKGPDNGDAGQADLEL